MVVVFGLKWIGSGFPICLLRGDLLFYLFGGLYQDPRGVVNILCGPSSADFVAGAVLSGP